MLQAPYFQRTVTWAKQNANGINENISVEKILDSYGKPAERVLGRYGLYCVGCHRAPTESLAGAAQAHGLAKVNWNE